MVFSITDVCEVLTGSSDGKNYWKVLKNRLKKEGSELVTNCNQLKMISADGKSKSFFAGEIKKNMPARTFIGGKTMKQHFALELYSVRNDLTNDFEGTLKAVKAMGYEGVEFAGDYVHSAEKVAAVLNETGLQCCGWHTPWSYVQDDKLDATIAYNKTVGNRYVIVPGLPKECTDSIEAWKATAEKFNALAKKLAAHDLVLGYHNHSSEFKAIDGVVPYDVFFGNTDKDIVMQLDNGNAMSGGADVCALIKRYPGRAQTVHIKPYSMSDGFDTMIGEDDIPLPEFMQLCDEVGGTKWYIVEYESEALHTPLAGVQLCYDAIMAMQAKGIILIPH